MTGAAPLEGFFGKAPFALFVALSACEASDAAPSSRPKPQGGSSSVAGSDGNAAAGGGGAGREGNAQLGSDGGGPMPPPEVDVQCDVQEVLADKCQPCHDNDPPGRLFTHVDFLAPSYSSSGLTVAEEALRRLTLGPAERMPPPPYELSDDELEVLRAWLAAGAPAMRCDAPIAPSPSPYDTPSLCTSGVYWTGGASKFMHPGMACLNCHAGNDGPDVAAAGTVYPTPHEPDDCHGVSDATQAVVVLTGSDGVEHVLPVNSAGNFLFDGALARPYRAKVVYDGRERVMLQPQVSGDCNGCHTEQGEHGAPGRIFLP